MEIFVGAIGVGIIVGLLTLLVHTSLILTVVLVGSIVVAIVLPDALADFRRALPRIPEALHKFGSDIMDVLGL